ncbi:MAG: thiamine biosynthesis protein ApbE [Caulobacteraceae bacterium]|nr:thiamine biosynthesis protein ApbE [Caulobacteraceae bacterium]
MSHSLSWLLAGVAALPAAAVAAPLQVHSFHEDHVLGTSFDMTVVADSPAGAAMARWAARDEIARLDKVLSTWRDDSEISRLNAATGQVAVSSDLQSVLGQAETWRQTTGGAFSARLGTVEAAWNQAEAAGVAPSPVHLASLAQAAAKAPLRIDANLVERPSAVKFAPDGLAKGYVIDAALAAAKVAAPGVRGLLIDIGGDMRCSGVAPSGDAWTVGVAAPRAADNAAPVQVLSLWNKAVATSGVGQRDRTIGGCPYSQTLSPFDGSAMSTPQVTVVANRAVDADALASALSVMSIKQGLALVERTPGAEARIVRTGGLAATSSGWNSLLKPVAVASKPSLGLDCAVDAGKPWPADFALNIDYTVPNINDPRHPPFVAVWISDKDGKMIRTLFHLGDHPPRYLNSNYVWWNAFQKATPELLGSITRPTRRPGTYTVAWDGKNDAGKLVGQGDYIVHIEASREHGGHSLQDIPISVGTTEANGASAGGGELGPTKVSYGKGQ